MVSVGYDDVISMTMQKAEYEEFMAGNVQSSGNVTHMTSKPKVPNKAAKQQLRQARELSLALRSGSFVLDRDPVVGQFRSDNSASAELQRKHDL